MELGLKSLNVEEAIAVIPSDFVSDGLSGGFPDWMYSRWNLGEIDGPHAHAYCTRCWPAGYMTHRVQKRADAQLRAHARSRLPWWLWLAPLVLFVGVTLGGQGSFDTCYANDPLDASSVQQEAGLCRHNIACPPWQVELLEKLSPWRVPT